MAFRARQLTVKGPFDAADSTNGVTGVEMLQLLAAKYIR